MVPRFVDYLFIGVRVNLINTGCCSGIPALIDMKKNVTRLLASMFFVVGTLALSGCQKEVDLSGYALNGHTHQVIQTKVKIINATFNASGRQVAEAQSNELLGLLTRDDAVLVYMNTGQNASGSTWYWTQLPFTDNESHGASWSFQIGDSGILYIKAACTEDYHWNNNFTKTFKVIVIPNAVYTEMKAKGVNHNNYNEVAAAYNLTEDADIAQMVIMAD